MAFAIGCGYNSRLHPPLIVVGLRPGFVQSQQPTRSFTQNPLKMVLLPRQAPNIPPLTPEYLAFDIAPKLLSVSGTLTALALFIFLLRAYVRAVMLRVFGVDDALMLVAVVRGQNHFPFCIK